MHRLRLCAALAFAVVLTTPVAAFTKRLGGEVVVNTFPTGVQERPAVAGLENGSYVVTWQSLGQDGSNSGIYFQRFGPGGAKRGTETRANTTTTGDQTKAAIAGLTNGRFAIAWQSRANTSSPANIFVQLFTATGAKVGGEILVSVQVPGLPFNTDASIARMPNGGFIVAWGACSAIVICPSGLTFAQRFNAAGGKLGGIFRLDTFGAASLPRVATRPNGTFVAVWQSLNQDANPGHGIYGQRFTAAGGKVGGEFLVNTRVTGSQVTPAIAMLDSGRFVVTWDSFGQDGSGNGIYMQRFGVTANRLGTETRVNPGTLGPQTQPAIAPLLDGGFVVLWTTDDSSFEGIRGRRFSATGAPLGNVFLVNRETSGIQQNAALVAYDDAHLVAVWTTEALLNVAAQRFLILQ